MNFKVIKDTVDESGKMCRPMDGYKFVGSVNIDKSVVDWSGNKWDQEIDSFYDGFEPLCVGNDGNTYSVMFDWKSKKPVIWQIVEEIDQ